MMKMIKGAILGIVTSLAIMGPCITTIAEEAVEMSAASSANSPLYSVVVPREISFGELRDTNYQLTYPIEIELYQPELGDVYIDSPNSIILTSGDTVISVNSTLRNSGVMDSREFEAMFWVEPTTVMTQTQGDYTGAIDFEFEFRADEVVSSNKATNVSGRDVGVVSNGFSELVRELEAGESFQFTATANSGLNKDYIKTVVTSMKKDGGDKSATVSNTSDVVEVRIPVVPLGVKEELQYNVRNITTEKNLSKLAARPEVGNYTDGQYFAGVDVIYIYTTAMQEYGIYTGEIDEGVYPPEYVPEPDEPTTPPVTGGDSDFAPEIGGNNGNTGTGDTNQPESNDDYVAPDLSGGDGDYTATVSMRRADQIDTLSMCDALFYTKADITLKGDDATVTLYVIDPIPMFANAGTPLSNVKYMYNSKDYVATVDSKEQAVKYFESASGFISESGNYYTTKIVSTIPKQAIVDSANGAVKIEAYVNAVMESTQQFYVVFGNMEKGDTLEDTDDSGVLNDNLDTEVNTGGESLLVPDTDVEQDSSLDMESADVSGGDGEYTAEVSMRRADDINTLSMCDSLFHSKADIFLEGDNAIVTLYVIDPIPMFVSAGTPLSNVKYMYQSKDYPSTVSSENQAVKYFESASGFINESGNYYATKIVTTIPKQAIADSVNGAVKIEAYVNAVMESTQQFYVVFSNMEKGNTDENATDSEVLNNNLSDTGSGNVLSPNDTTSNGGSTGTADVSGGDGEYTADVSMRRADDINTLSMCDALFYSQADIVLSGDDATVTIYVIDPIPMYADLGTPLLDVKYMYKSKDYIAKYTSTNKEAKYFSEASGFISEAGNYYTSKISVTIPKQAIAESVNGELMVEAYVNVVMESTQKFYAVFSNLEKGTTETETDTSNIIDVDGSGGNSQNGSDSSGGNNGSTSYGDDLAAQGYANSGGVFGSTLDGKTVGIIFGLVLTGLVSFFGYAYYLKRKREIENV